MKNIRLTSTKPSARSVLVNWDNVDFVNETASHYGDKYTEVHCGKQIVDVVETLDQIELLLNNDN